MTQARVTTTRYAHATLLLLAVEAVTAFWSEGVRAEANSANSQAIPMPPAVKVVHSNVAAFPVEPSTGTEPPSTGTPVRSSITELASSEPARPVQTAQPMQPAPLVAAEPTAPEELPGFARAFPSHPVPKDGAPTPAPRQHALPRQLGMTFDVGLPDGAILGIAYRPAFWTRLQAGAGTNAISPGVRAGASLLPFGSGPSLTLEGGWYFEGDANSVIGKVAGSDYSSSRTGERIGYQFANLHLGLDFGSKYSTFFLHGGMTYLHTRLHDASDTFGGQTVGSDGSVTTYSFNQDLTLNAFFPSFKLGIIVYIV